MNNPKKIYFLGNSQLITSVIPAFCSPEIHQQVGADWRDHRVSKGTFTSESGTEVSFQACNMGMLGDPSRSGQTLFYSPEFMNFLEMVDADVSVIYLMLRGNEFGIESLVDAAPRWDFSYSGQGATKGRQFVHQADAAAHFDKIMNPLLATCMLVKHKFPNAVIFHIAAPPPVESETHILSDPESFGTLFEHYGVRPFALRKKIYDAMYDKLASTLREFGVQSIFAPADCLTEAGGLKEEYAHGTLHGNKLYGKSLIAALQKDFVNASV
jgi:hypothetical protein